MKYTFITCLAIARALAIPLEQRANNGPVITKNFMDPCVMQGRDGKWYAYSGPNGNPALHVQLATSSDFVNWQLVTNHEVLPNTGAWTAPSPRLWAPDVNLLANGQYIMYYAAAMASNPSKHCVGAARSLLPQGPFIPQDTPLFCDLAAGGSIDPNGLLDPQSGNQYVVYKIDGNSNGHGGACSNTVPPIQSTPIVLQQVSNVDGMPIGTGVTILTNIAEDGPLVEAPALAYNPSSQTYFLFYNSGCYVDTSYTIKYATSSQITGPYTRRGTFLTSGSTAANVQVPGSIDLISNNTKAIFHADTNLGWLKGDGTPRVRAMFAMDLTLSGLRAAAGPLL